MAVPATGAGTRRYAPTRRTGSLAIHFHAIKKTFITALTHTVCEVAAGSIGHGPVDPFLSDIVEDFEESNVLESNSYSRFEPIEFSISSQPTSAGLFFTRQRINLA